MSEITLQLTDSSYRLHNHGHVSLAQALHELMTMCQNAAEVVHAENNNPYHTDFYLSRSENNSLWFAVEPRVNQGGQGVWQQVRIRTDLLFLRHWYSWLFRSRRELELIVSIDRAKQIITHYFETPTRKEFEQWLTEQ